MRTIVRPQKKPQKKVAVKRKTLKPNKPVKVSVVPPQVINVGGAPTKFHEGLASLAFEYVKTCRDETGYKNKGSDKAPFWVFDAHIPQLDEFAEICGVSEKTVQNWRSAEMIARSKAHETFNDAVEHIVSAQKQMLIQLGLLNKLNSKITALLLAANHDVIDKKQTENKHLHMITEMFAVHKRAEELAQARIHDQ